MKLQTIHLRVNDGATGRPTPCRIRITDPSGMEYPPLGRPRDFSARVGEDVGGQLHLASGRWWSIDGACEIGLPPGELRVQVRKGIDYLPIDDSVRVPPGKMALRFVLNPHTVTQKPAATSVDMRCHFGSPLSAGLDAAAEGLDVANLLIEPRRFLGSDGRDYESIPNGESFSGQTEAVARSDSRVIVNTHNRHPVLGSLALLHSHRAVYPLTFGGGDASDDWSLDDWADQCHRKDGYVVWTDPFGRSNPNGGEALALAVLGKLDAYELTPDNHATAVQQWQRLLHAGVRVPLVGSSGRVGNARPLGAMRTVFWQEPGEFRRTLREGLICVTNGPVVMCDPVGDEWVATAKSLQPFAMVELIAFGKVIASEPAQPESGGGPLWVASVAARVRGNYCLMARARGQEKSRLDDATPLFAQTSARVVGEPGHDPDAVSWVLDCLRKSRDWVENVGRFENPKSQAHLCEVFDRAVAAMSQ